ncbi:MAG: hypothetical protein PHN31_02920, partial [Candidatus Gracilibacteria bacterium]|nr:hypothetical protein [Candidatus Gracilibacteria bacterium]
MKITSDLILEKVEAIIKGENSSISLDLGMQKKIKSIYDLLKKEIYKIIKSALSDSKQELEGSGKGTMILNLENAKFTKLLNKGLFEMIYKKNTEDKCWKKRTQEEKDKIFSNYTVLEINGIVLGGYALSDYEIDGVKGKILECMFSSKTGAGIGYMLGDEIKKHEVVYAYSKQSLFFNKLGFKKIEGKKSETGSDLFVYK